MKHSSDQHIRFAVIAADVAIFTLRGDELLVRLMRVNRPPFFNNIAGLPGGLIQPDETAEKTAERIIEEKGGIRPSIAHLEQLATFSALKRDPRGRVVAVAYSAYIPWEKLSTTERENTKECWWQNVSVREPLAYDHPEILRAALERLRSRITYTTVISKLMPREYTLTQLEEAYEIILHEKLDKRNFRKKLEKLKLLEETGKMTSGEQWRPAKLYRFKSSTVQNIEML